MAYLIGERMALMHPPKTAGLWARGACQVVGLPWERFGPIGKPDDQHSDAAPPDDRYVIAFVRHPVNWLKSFYMFHERTGWEQYSDAPGFIFYANHRRGEGFQQFVARYLERMPGAVGRMFDRYIVHADEVGRVESINEDIKRFIARVYPSLDLTQIDDLDRLNASAVAQKLSTNYAPGQVDAIKRAERDYMRRWRYE